MAQTNQTAAQARLTGAGGVRPGGHMIPLQTLTDEIRRGLHDAAFIRLYGDDAAERSRARCRSLLSAYSASYGDGPVAVVSAPGRTELAGNHTDHNHGKVLAGSVNLDFIAAVGPTDEPVVRLRSEGFPGEFTVRLTELEPVPAERGRFEALVRGTAAGLHAAGRRIGGFSGCITSQVLPGSGLSSSAAVEVLVGMIFNLLYNESSIPPEELAKIGRYAENAFFGKPCGLMDQMACAIGGIIAIDFADPERPVYERVTFPFERYGYALVVADTGGSHADLTEEYAAVPAEMKAVAARFGSETLRTVKKEEVLRNVSRLRDETGDRAVLRALHYFADNGRVERMIGALREGKLSEYFALVRESGSSSWRLLQNCYTAQNPSEQGITLALALTEEFLGSDGAFRVHGGGFAGTIQAYVPAARLSGYREMMEAAFGEGCVTPITARATGVTTVLA